MGKGKSYPLYRQNALKTLKKCLKWLYSYFFGHIRAYMCVFISVYLYGCKGSQLVSIKPQKAMHKIGLNVQFWVIFVKKVENFRVK
jgi:hypothetical protein